MLAPLLFSIMAPAPTQAGVSNAPAGVDPASGRLVPEARAFRAPARGLLDEMRSAPQGRDENKVFAHYFPPYPRSIDNKPPAEDYYAVNYLTLHGEGGKHRAYGGLLRDRPLGRAPLEGGWRLKDMRVEVRQAQAAGIDGFTLDILALSGRTWGISRRVMRAADREGFEIIPTLDASSVDASPTRAAAKFAKLYAHPSAQKFGRKHVLASFLAEARSVRWWRALKRELRLRHGIPVKFIAVFNNPSDANLRAFAPISHALSAWGYRNAAGAAQGPDYAARAHALGVKWMHTVAVQDARPRSGAYAEAGNTDTLRTTWARAIGDGADLVQIATWNDYGESTSIAPSEMHGYNYLALMGYFAAWFTDGRPPAIRHDHLILTHRTHFADARATSGAYTMAPTLGGSQVTPRDTVEALVFLTSPALVTVTSGTHTKTVRRPAGVSKVLVKLDTGRPWASIARGTNVVKIVRSPHQVVDDPYVLDFQYVASGS